MRVFPSKSHFVESDGEPIRTVITSTKEATLVAWVVRPGQKIAPHIHPHGQDTWTILSGSGDYITDRIGGAIVISTGDVVVAKVGEVHGVINLSNTPLTFISVVSPGEAGYELIG
jgi:quercetin dioxygenase-like cupin family protein